MIIILINIKTPSFITVIQKLNLKLSSFHSVDTQKYLIVCFSDGHLSFYNILCDGNQLIITRKFLCLNANEGLPYLVNSTSSNVDRSITDPNYKLKLPLTVFHFRKTN